jgi:hypothetical protein
MDEGLPYLGAMKDIRFIELCIEGVMDDNCD